MKSILAVAAVAAIFTIPTFAQKGVDTQTRKIREVSVPGTQITSNNNNTFDFGKDKTKTRAILENPYRLSARRDILVGNIVDLLKERKLLVDENASRPQEGFIVTEPFTFAKGAVITQSELVKYAVIPDSAVAFTRGRYTLTIEVQSIDGVQNNVSVTAKVEGKSESGLRSEWTTLESTGIVEDDFLAKLVEMVTGQTLNVLKN